MIGLGNARKWRVVARLMALLCAPLAGGMAHANPATARTIMVKIDSAVLDVRHEGTINARTDAAERLAGLVPSVQGKSARGALVGVLVKLLDSRDDGVRYWVARAIGNVGPAAKIAIPRLQKLLARVKCLNGAITSADGIRYALFQLGVKPPLQTCNHPRIAA
jgi:hypothetical protein